MKRYARRTRKTEGGTRTFGAFIIKRIKASFANLQLGKTGGAILSMLAALAVYAWFYQWEFALGLTAMVLAHELGHVAAARRVGIPVTVPFFIPFVGALIMLKRNPRDAVTEAYVAMGGPLVGAVAAFVTLLIGWVTGNSMFYAIAYIGFTLNLINLLPIHPLDGGRIATTVTRWLWVVGLVGGLVIVIYMKSILFFLLWALFAWDLFVKYVSSRGKIKDYLFWGKIEVPFEDMPGNIWMLELLREKEPLPFRTYSRLSDGKQEIVIEWEQAGVEKTVKMPEQAIILSVESTRVERRWQQSPKVVVLHFQIGYKPHENDHYYDRPREVRWKFGAAYAVLALFLMGMMYVSQKMIALEPSIIPFIK